MGLLNEAIELDPQSGEAYVERGYLNLYFDVAEADADLRRGLELAPNLARGYEGLAAVLFQSVARRREALEMLEKARKLDPLEIRLDVLKALYLEWGPGNYAEADRMLQAVLERDPLFVPALVRLADVRWGGQGRHAEAVALGEQAVALDPGNETAWRHLVLSYISVGEVASALAAFSKTADHPALAPMIGHLFRNEWRAGRRAGLRSDRRRADLFPDRSAGCARHTQARARDGRLSTRHQGARKLGVRRVGWRRADIGGPARLGASASRGSPTC